MPGRASVIFSGAIVYASPRRQAREKRPCASLAPPRGSGYAAGMRRLLPSACLALFLTLAACGPKDIGTGTSDPDMAPPGVSSVENLRQPMTGANPIQRRLFFYNQPHIMMQMQQSGLDNYRRYINRHNGGVDPESPEYREVPRQRSPFRQ